MIKIHRLLFYFSFSISCLVAQEKIILFDVNVIDGVNSNVQKDMMIFISNGKIESIKNIGSRPKGYRVIDLNGMYILPGFIDAHTHISSLDAAKRALESGVTTARSASTSGFQDVSIREMVKAGKLIGPDMIAAGIFVTPNLGETILADVRLADLSNGVNKENELRKLVQINVDRGVDIIKTRGTERAGLPYTDPRKQTYTEKQLSIVVNEASKYNIPVMAHAHGDEGGFAAVKAGVRSIEHGTYLSKKTLSLMKKKGTYLVPTYTTVVDLTEPGGDYDNPILFIRGQHMLPALKATVKTAYEMGVKIATGADTRYGSNSTTRVGMEITNFVELGMKPIDAIRSATIIGAELLLIDDKTGSIEVGKEADLIVVTNNPLKNIRTIQDVVFVMSNGKIGLKRIPFNKD